MPSYTVWKTVLKPAHVQDIDVPDGAELLCAREQFNQMCVWFKCDPDAPTTKRTLAIVGTGHAAPPGARYVGSCMMDGGQFVFHVFERVGSWTETE